MLYSPLVRRFFSIATVASALLTTAHAQPAKPEFEAASIRPSEAGGFHFGSDAGTSTGGPGTPDPGMYRCTRCTLATLVAKAWNLQNYQLPGRASLGTTPFDVMARVHAGATPDEFQAMLQNLLKERFSLTGHFTEKALKGYHLAVAKNGPKLQESTDAAKPAVSSAQHGGFGQGFGGGDHGHTGVISFGGNARYRADHQTTAELARVLADQLGLPVDDQTGLKGNYDISLNWTGTTSNDDSHAAGSPAHSDHGGAPGGAPAARPEPGDAPTIFEAVQSQLGLRLVRADQATARIFIVDHAEQQPTAN